MKSVLVIGLGNFGMLIVKQIHELGHQVMAIDKNESRVNEAFTEEPSDMWTSLETWMCALQSGLCIRKKTKSASGREPESWQTAYRKKNLKSARTRQERW